MSPSTSTGASPTLHQASERISANLVDLEIDSGRQLLEATKLEGQSAIRWAAASQALTELWRRHGLLESLLTRADELRRSRRTDEVDALLSGRSIELTSSEVPIARRELLASAQDTERCSPDELLASMSAAFDEVKTVLSEIGSAWERLVPAIDDARRRLHAATELVDELHQSDRPDLEAAGQRLTDLDATITADPLSVDPHEIDALARTIDQIRLGARGGRRAQARLRGADPARRVRRSSSSGSLRSELRAAHQELVVKISVPGAPRPPRSTTTARASSPGSPRSHSAGPGRRRAPSWTRGPSASPCATTRPRGCSGQVAFRSRRATSCGRCSMPTRSRPSGSACSKTARSPTSYTRAQAVLYNAPTDLDLAAQLVRAYQEMVNGSPSSSEALL